MYFAYQTIKTSMYCCVRCHHLTTNTPRGAAYLNSRPQPGAKTFGGRGAGG